MTYSTYLLLWLAQLAAAGALFINQSAQIERGTLFSVGLVWLILLAVDLCLKTWSMFVRYSETTAGWVMAACLLSAPMFMLFSELMFEFYRPAKPEHGIVWVAGCVIGMFLLIHRQQVAEDRERARELADFVTDAWEKGEEPPEIPKMLPVYVRNEATGAMEWNGTYVEDPDIKARTKH